MKYLLLTISLITSFSYAVCTANVNMGSNSIQNLASPISNSDAANKAYVDNKINTLDDSNDSWSMNNTNVVLNSGSVGIGTSSPVQLLHINSASTAAMLFTNSASSSGLYLGIVGTSSYLWGYEDGPLYFATNDSTKMTITSNGKVGIGTNQPQASLHINNTDAIIIPVGSTVQRPATPVVGMIRLNSTTSLFEGYTGSAWVELSN